MSGSSSTPKSPTATPVTSLRLQTSTRGRPIPMLYGKPRVTGNLIWAGDFVSTQHDSTSGGDGKGGGGGGDTTTTTFTYSCALIMALGRGPINAVTTVWRGKDIVAGGSSTSTVIANEYHTVPSTGPYTITADRASTFLSNSAVLIENQSSAYQTGQYAGYARVPLNSGTDYTVSAGVYTFSAAFAGRAVYLAYNVSTTTLDVSSSAGFALSPGSSSQLALSWMTSKHPTQALGYRNVAYVSASSYSLGDTADMPNHSFEIDTGFAFSATIRDANPKDVIPDVLSNPVGGAGFPQYKIGDMTTFSKYCVANNIFISPAYQEQEAARDILERMMKITNSGVYNSGGMLKFVPFGDVSATANGVTYTPNLTPVYDLTDDDFIGDSSDDPIKVTRKPISDAYNSVTVKFNNRTQNYNEDFAVAKDQANIELFGLRAMDTVDLKEICDPVAARSVAQIMLQRALYIRNTYEFRLNWSKALLEPMDLVTLTDSGMGLNKLPVRILTVEEDETGELTLTAEEFPLNVCNAATYSTQAALGYATNFNASAGNCTTPVFFEPPIEIATSNDQLDLWIATGGGSIYGGCEVWVSLDGTTYKRMTTLNGASRYGSTTATLGSETVPGISSTKTLSVSLAAGGQLLSGTLADAQVNNTLCYVGGEFLSYQTATLTGTSAYNLTILNRGAYGSTQPSHASGQDFVRVDNTIAKIPLTLDYIGKTLYVKLLSFNIYGGGMQGLADVSPYNFTITGRFVTLAPPDVASLTVTVKPDGTRQFSWPATGAPKDVINGGGYRIKYRTSGSGTAWASMTTLTDGLITATPYQTNNPQAGTYDFAIVAVDKLSNESANPQFVSSATIGNEPVTYGSAINMLGNSDWVINTGTNSGIGALYQWSQSSTISGGSTFARNAVNNIGRGGAAVTDTGSIGTTNTTLLYQDVPVVVGNTYEFSSYQNAINCQSALKVIWLDSGGATLSTTTIATNTTAGGTNPKLTDYVFLWGTATAPASAAKARFVVSKQATNTGQTTSTLYTQRAMMCLARTGVTVQTATPWIEAGTDYMHGGGIEPATVDTSQLANNAATTLLSNQFASGGTMTVGRVGSAGPTANSDFTTLLTVTFTPVITGTVLVTAACDIDYFANASTVTFFDIPIGRIDTGSYVAADNQECNSRTGSDPTGFSSAARANFVFRKYISVTSGVSTTVSFRVVGRSQASYTYTARNAYLQVEVIKK